MWIRKATLGHQVGDLVKICTLTPIPANSSCASAIPWTVNGPPASPPTISSAPSETRPRVEASIGRLYLNGGLDAAFEWMNSNLIPLFRKQTANKR
jgi:hypothetical protein